MESMFRGGYRHWRDPGNGPLGRLSGEGVQGFKQGATAAGRAVQVLRPRQKNSSSVGPPMFAAKSLVTPAKAGVHGRNGSRLSCCVPEHWCDSPSVWQAVEWLQLRLADGGTAQLVPVVHRRDPRARAAIATGLAARRAGGPCGPTGASVLPERRRRSGSAQGKAAPWS